MTFGEKLKFLRELHGITQEDLVNRLNVFAEKKKQQLQFTINQVKQWETSHNFPNMERSLLLSQFFSLSLDALFKPNEKPLNSKIAIRKIVLN